MLMISVILQFLKARFSCKNCLFYNPCRRLEGQRRMMIVTNSNKYKWQNLYAGLNCFERIVDEFEPHTGGYQIMEKLALPRFVLSVPETTNQGTVARRSLCHENVLTF